nr:GGDEF domain-containing protein [Desulfobulbaceae bacterium]
MNIENFSTSETTEDNFSLNSSLGLNSLVVELEHYRRQSEWLSLVNELHGRLAGAVDLPSMLEAFSVWLMPLVPHELLAYNNQVRERLHLLCSCHGPERERAMKIAKSALNNAPACENSCCWTEEEFYIQSWQLDAFRGSGLLLLLRKDRQIGEYELQLIAKGLKILCEPLQRALEYEDLYEQASRDALTGLVNRRVFDERIDPILAQSKRHGHPVTLACMDLDKFKHINDTYGHAVGDLVLQKVSSAMERMVRSCDVLARMGGDEFMLIMPDTDLKSAKILANRLCEKIGKISISALDKGEIGISIGLVEWNAKFDKKLWIKRADEALYKAKSNGRSRVSTL